VRAQGWLCVYLLPVLLLLPLEVLEESLLLPLFPLLLLLLSLELSSAPFCTFASFSLSTGNILSRC
jgi:hypothetical protein